MKTENTGGKGRAMTEEELLAVRGIVAEEIGAAKSEPSPSIWRHPLMVTILGFALTTGVLTGYEWFERGQERKREMRASEQAQLEIWRANEILRVQGLALTARETLSEAVRAIQSRALEADLLRSALDRGSPSEAAARKSRYDEAFRDWNIGFDQRFVGLSESLKLGAPALNNVIDFAAVVDETASERDFAPMDLCLTKAFDLGRAQDFEKLDRSLELAQCDRKGWYWFTKKKAQDVRSCSRMMLRVGLMQIDQIERQMVAYLYELPKRKTNWEADLTPQSLHNAISPADKNRIKNCDAQV